MPTREPLDFLFGMSLDPPSRLQENEGSVRCYPKASKRALTLDTLENFVNGPYTTPKRIKKQPVLVGTLKRQDPEISPPSFPTSTARTNLLCNARRCLATPRLAAACLEIY